MKLIIFSGASIADKKVRMKVDLLCKIVDNMVEDDEWNPCGPSIVAQGTFLGHASPVLRNLSIDVGCGAKRESDGGC